MNGVCLNPWPLDKVPQATVYGHAGQIIAIDHELLLPEFIILPRVGVAGRPMSLESRRIEMTRVVIFNKSVRPDLLASMIAYEHGCSAYLPIRSHRTMRHRGLRAAIEIASQHAV